MVSTSPNPNNAYSGNDVSKTQAPVAVILAGGRAQRFGGLDKCLLSLRGQPLLRWITNTLSSQVPAIALSANGDKNRFSGFNMPILPDPLPGFQGPLMGVWAGLSWATEINDHEWVLIVSGDTPFIPSNLVMRLCVTASEASADKKLIAPVTNGHTHYLCALWRKEQLPNLQKAVEEEGRRSIRSWIKPNEAHLVSHWDQRETIDPFFNINTAEDLSIAESYVRVDEA